MTNNDVCAGVLIYLKWYWQLRYLNLKFQVEEWWHNDDDDDDGKQKHTQTEAERKIEIECERSIRQMNEKEWEKIHKHSYLATIDITCMFACDPLRHKKNKHSFTAAAPPPTIKNIWIFTHSNGVSNVPFSMHVNNIATGLWLTQQSRSELAQ